MSLSLRDMELPASPLLRDGVLVGSKTTARRSVSQWFIAANLIVNDMLRLYKDHTGDTIAGTHLHHAHSLRITAEGRDILER